ncbi:MAG: phosphate ABC transporter permease PstA [Caldisericota bacterium]|jgi:phosphate transport system permease protein|nr:phosphate ABC transporter permease PstA [Caldisericota bacterium]
MSFRKLKNATMGMLVAATALLIIAILVIILWHIFISGAKYLNWDFFTRAPASVGESGGGVVNAIIGTFLITVVAAAIGTPFGMLAGIYVSENRGKRFADIVRLCADALQGVPSIVIGIFGYTFIVARFRSYSAIAASISLAFMFVPTTARVTEEVLNLVPSSLKEAAYALGARPSSVIWNVSIKTAAAGITSGLLTSMARIAGETAPLLFTAFGSRYIEWNMSRPMAALPLQIFIYAGSPYPSLQQQAWSAAFVLVLLILLLQFSARRLISRILRIHT